MGINFATWMFVGTAAIALPVLLVFFSALVARNFILAFKACKK